MGKEPLFGPGFSSSLALLPKRRHIDLLPGYPTKSGSEAAARVLTFFLKHPTLINSLLNGTDHQISPNVTHQFITVIDRLPKIVSRINV